MDDMTLIGTVMLNMFVISCVTIIDAWFCNTFVFPSKKIVQYARKNKEKPDISFPRTIRQFSFDKIYVPIAFSAVLFCLFLPCQGNIMQESEMRYFPAFLLGTLLIYLAVLSLSCKTDYLTWWSKNHKSSKFRKLALYYKIFLTVISLIFSLTSWFCVTPTMLQYLLRFLD
jgi:hypothetical protein